MDDKAYLRKAFRYLETLCGVKPNRRTGSAGNREAVRYFAETIKGFGYEVETTPFPCLDYARGDAKLKSEMGEYQIFTSPYSLGCDVAGKIVPVSTPQELENCSCQGEILLMYGSLCDEQLMPKNFVFYNPEHHQRIIALLEEKKPAAIITATKRNPEMVGALYPFPLILDGDFNIPVAYCTDVVGDDILGDKGSKVQILIESERFASSASNIIARKNAGDSSKILVTAHIDAYEDTPGASDNASGTAVLLLLAEMLSDYDGDNAVEIAALNGEDHYSAGGQMDYLARYRDEFDNILLLINIDDVGYIQGRTAYSTYGLPAEIQGKAEKVFEASNGFVLGEPWYNGDHMIFVQSGVPAMALTAELTPELMRTITHTAEDTLDKVDPARLVGLANTLSLLVRQL